ncbi:HAMP domain-containing protein, partial [Cutibacterium acnes]
LWMAAPWWDFVPGLTVWLAALVGFGIAVSLAAAWIARRAARQLAEPLEYLAQAAQAVGQLSLAQPIRTDWRTREVYALARAMNESRRRLRI